MQKLHKSAKKGDNHCHCIICVVLSICTKYVGTYILRLVVSSKVLQKCYLAIPIGFKRSKSYGCHLLIKKQPKKVYEVPV